MLISVVVIAIIGVAVILSVFCPNYWRNPPDYSKILAKASITYLVSYDSGDGDVVGNSTFTLKVAETDVLVGNDTCFYTVTVMDPYPVRKV
ncbi:MAG: hypothetical protein AMJ93_17195, partial [Anaerolineae bacterium SM23_84]